MAQSDSTNSSIKRGSRFGTISLLAPESHLSRLRIDSEERPSSPHKYELGVRPRSFKSAGIRQKIDQLWSRKGTRLSMDAAIDI